MITSPLAKVYEAYSAVADGRVEMKEDEAYVISSDHTKKYTVRFLENTYSLAALCRLSNHSGRVDARKGSDKKRNLIIF